MEKLKLSEIKSNPNNPRLIKDDKFKKLVQSIKDFPEMLEKRPIVVNSDMVVLGGNMRLKACKEAGLKEVPVIIADWTEEQQKEFIIKDNSNFGEWNYDMLANEWSTDDLEAWGINTYFSGSEFNDMDDEDVDILEEFDPYGTAKGHQRVVFIFDGPDEAESYLKSLNVEFVKRNMAWQVNMNTPST